MRLDFLPDGLLEDLRACSGADLVVLYLSEPTAPFARSGYLMLGALGVDPRYLPRMRGTLRPESIQHFSITDRKKRLVVADVKADADASGFARQHGVRSLVRLSRRLNQPEPRGTDEPGLEPGAALRRIPASPTLLEIFLSFTAPRDEAELQKTALKAERFFTRKRLDSIREHPVVRQIMNLRTAGHRYRRVHDIANQVAEHADLHALTRAGIRSRVDSALQGLASALASYTGLKRSTMSLAIYHVHEWSARDVTLRLVFTDPPGRRRELVRRVASNSVPSICRFAALNRTSIVLEDLAAEPEFWRELSGSPAAAGLQIVMPLYTGKRLTGVLAIESPERHVSPLGLANLVRLMPQLDTLMKDVFALDAVTEDVLLRQTQNRLLKLPIHPRNDAVNLRLETVRKYLQADDVFFADWDGEGFLSRHWRGEGQGTAGPLPAAVAAAAADLRGFLTEQSRYRAVAWERSLAFPELDVTIGYTIHYKGELGRVERHFFAPGEVLPRALPALEVGGAKPPEVCSYVAVPLWYHRPEEADQRYVRAILMARWIDQRHTPTPLHVQNLANVAKSLTVFLQASEKVALRTSLYTWAIAGVGPLHQLQNVLVECRRDVEELAGDEATKERALRRLNVFGEQLFVLHQFAKREQPFSVGDASVDVRAMIDDAVAGTRILWGLLRSPIDVQVDPSCAGLAMHVSQGMPITAVLTCAISNSVQYGKRLLGVFVRRDPNGERLVVTVRNEAIRSENVRHLELACGIARRVNEGDTHAVFENLAVNADHRGNRGLGTWLAAGITKKMLGGRYELDYVPHPEDAQTLLVTASMSIPCRFAARAPRLGEDGLAAAAS